MWRNVSWITLFVVFLLSSLHTWPADQSPYNLFFFFFLNPSELKCLNTASCSVQDGEIDAEELQRCLTQSGFTGSYTRKFTTLSLPRKRMIDFIIAALSRAILYRSVRINALKWFFKNSSWIAKECNMPSHALGFVVADSWTVRWGFPGGEVSNGLLNHHWNTLTMCAMFAGVCVSSCEKNDLSISKSTRLNSM